MNKLTQDTLKAFKTYDIGYLMEARFRMGIVAGLFNNEITSFEVDNPNASHHLLTTAGFRNAHILRDLAMILQGISLSLAL